MKVVQMCRYKEHSSDQVKGATTEEAVAYAHETMDGKSGGCSPGHRAPAFAITLDTDLDGLVAAV